MSIVFVNKVPNAARLPRAVIISLFAKAQKVLKKNLLNKSVSVLFVSAEDSKKLNYKYRSKQKPTNVLSFPSSQKDELGDIIICPVIASQESSKQKIGFVWWIGYLFIHGLLHLLGYDHKTKKESIKMNNLTEKIICD